MRVTAVGQSTFVVTLADGRVLVTDPWFGSHPIAPRAIPLPTGFDTLPPCAIVLASHNHVDHVEGRSLSAAARLGATVAGPPSIARRARFAGVRDARPLRRGDVITVDGVSVEAVAADHPLCCAPVGFLVTDADGTTLYHSGDTRYDTQIVEDLDGRTIDMACVQIAASTYPVIGRDGMHVADAARLAAAIGARRAIPMHYHVRGKTTDPRRFADALGDAALVLAPGEHVDVAAAARP